MKLGLVIFDYIMLYYKILHFVEDSDYDVLAPSCKALHDEGATQSGNYKLSVSSDVEHYYCHSSKQALSISPSVLPSVHPSIYSTAVVFYEVVNHLYITDGGI